MKGYKAFSAGLRCRGFQYEVGKTYKHDGEIGLCKSGFHFCKTASDCANYYDRTTCEFAEIEAIGKVVEGDDKCVTDEIKVVRIISGAEFYELANDGKDNIGIRNTGDGNTGNSNTGYGNTGDRNTGIRNTGYGNTGDRNTGDRNTGYWNNTNRSTGFFCTEVQTVKVFDIDTAKTYEELVELLPESLWHIPFGCYWTNDKFKTYTAKDRQDFYDKLTAEQKQSIKHMPHFDAEKFEKCTGIRVDED